MNTLYKTIATGFGSGYSPIAPGTAGAIVGCLLLWAYAHFVGIQSFIPFQVGFLVVIVCTTLIGVYVTQKLEPEWGEDPSRVVIDEIVGVWIAVLFLPLTIENLLIGFLLFRIFDIWKPLGIRKLEAIPNGWGVMLDDVAAGVVANLLLHLGLWLLKNNFPL